MRLPFPVAEVGVPSYLNRFLYLRPRARLYARANGHPLLCVVRYGETVQAGYAFDDQCQLLVEIFEEWRNL